MQLRLRFWHESEKIESTLFVANEIQKLSNEDVTYSDMYYSKEDETVTILLKDSEKGLITKQTHFHLPEDMKKQLEDTGTLDFTFLDKEWTTLLHKYNFTNLAA